VGSAQWAAGGFLAINSAFFGAIFVFFRAEFQKSGYRGKITRIIE
jgi:hypothetical protein